MLIIEAKILYLEQKNYFAPDYKRENKVLEDFKQQNPNLDLELTQELIQILINSDWVEKFFVADLLYLYENMDISFFEPLLQTALQYDDPSFNRIFLTPAVKSFGLKNVQNYYKLRSGSYCKKETLNYKKIQYWLDIFSQHTDYFYND